MTQKDAFRIGRALRADFLTDCTEEELGEVFENFSQYSPWEFTAKDFNESRSPDSTWAEFERGLYSPSRSDPKPTQESDA